MHLGETNVFKLLYVGTSGLSDQIWICIGFKCVLDVFTLAFLCGLALSDIILILKMHYMTRCKWGL